MQSLSSIPAQRCTRSPSLQCMPSCQQNSQLILLVVYDRVQCYYYYYYLLFIIFVFWLYYYYYFQWQQQQQQQQQQQYFNDVSSDFKLILCIEIDKEELHIASIQEIKWSDDSDEPPGYTVRSPALVRLMQLWAAEKSKRNRELHSCEGPCELGMLCYLCYTRRFPIFRLGALSSGSYKRGTTVL